MSQETTSVLERDAERARANVADTAEQLKEKMSPGQLMDEVFNYFKASGESGQFFGNLKDQVRDNPLALAMVGGGIAWLMMGSGPDRGHGSHAASAPTSASQEDNRISGDAYGTEWKPSDETSHGSTVGDAASGLGSAAGDMANQVSDAATRTMHNLRDSAGSGLNRASQTGSDMAGRASSTLMDALDREPLVLGALGVALGAAIGAMLPSTRLEQQYLGGTSSKLRDDASDLVSEGIDKAKEVASDVYAAARDEADNQGFTSRDKPVVDKLADVARAAGDELKAAAHETVDTVASGAKNISTGRSAAEDKS